MFDFRFEQRYFVLSSSQVVLSLISFIHSLFVPSIGYAVDTTFTSTYRTFDLCATTLPYPLGLSLLINNLVITSSNTFALDPFVRYHRFEGVDYLETTNDLFRPGVSAL